MLFTFAPLCTSPPGPAGNTVKLKGQTFKSRPTVKTLTEYMLNEENQLGWIHKNQGKPQVSIPYSSWFLQENKRQDF